jgi:uncharacterized protein (TIGR03437 family)
VRSLLFVLLLPCAFGQSYTISTIAGTQLPGSSGDNGPSTAAQLSFPWGVATDSAGNLYIADTNNNHIRKVTNGLITTVAVNGTLGNPAGITVDSTGNLYIASSNVLASNILKVSAGVITNVAGNNGPSGFAGDGALATSARLNSPVGIAVDSAGNLYVADQLNNRIRKIANGVITTVAGNGTPGFSGDNGPATDAQLQNPFGVAVDSAGTLYIADTNNHRVRKVQNGVITTIAGGGVRGLGDNGPATSAQLAAPAGIAVDTTGNLFVTDLYDNRVRKVTGGVIATVAGNGMPGFAGDTGPAASAQLSGPLGVAADSAGNVYIADEGNNRIRLLTPNPGPSLMSVNNAASNLNDGYIAAGEVVVLYGSDLGPGELVSAQSDSSGFYPTQLAGASIQFNGIPAAMIYTSAKQAAAVVPFEITGANAQITVTYEGQTSSPILVPLAASAPGLFTLDPTGKGQALALNQNGSINAPSAPAPIGSVISLFATGAGQSPVAVTIGGTTVDRLQYVGGAPGKTAGLLQIDVPIPAAVTPGNAVPVVVRMGGAPSQPGVTIAVSAN